MSSLYRREANAGAQLKKSQLWSKFKANLAAGLLILLPLYLTYVILVKLFLFIDGILNRLATRALVSALNLPLNEDQIIYGLGLITLVIVVLVTGSIARNFVGNRLLILFNLWVDRIPIIKTIYKTLRQISEAIFSTKSGALNTPVIIEYPRSGIYSLAFRTPSSTGKVETAIGEECISVFLPSTPNPTTGFLLFVPKTQVREVAMSSEEAIKLIISGGMISQEEVFPETSPKA